MKHSSVIDYSMKSIMDSSIRKAIQHSGYSDIELGHKLNVSRSTIFKWRTIENYKIRSSNIIALAKALNKEPHFDKGYVSFTNKEIKLTNQEDADMDFRTDDLINDLRNDKKDLRKLLETKDSIILTMQKQIDNLIKKIQNLSSLIEHTDNLPQIDHHALQVITNRDNLTFHSVSTSIAKLLGYNPIVMLQDDFSWDDVIHSDDHFKFPLLLTYASNKNDKESYEDAQYKIWKCTTRHGKIIYLNTYAISVGNKYSFVECEVSSKKDYDAEIKKIAEG